MKKRNYDKELLNTKDHEYAYNFDLDVMHPFILRSFSPFFRPGNLLELGSYKGDFTARLLKYFTIITCVEASSDAVQDARKKIGDQAEIINNEFKFVKLRKKYNNIILTHVLEHLDDPVFVLNRINKEWLSEEGRLFIACPNSNAPSRQIAVKMGLISHNSAITKSERVHGHRITYSFDTLERDVRKAGLNVRYQSGVFFKALANFQWDQLLKTDIVSLEYLEGCYQLGHIYPDLCSSIIMVCEKGEVKDE